MNSDGDKEQLATIQAGLSARVNQEIDYTSLFGLTNDIRVMWGLEIIRRYPAPRSLFPSPTSKRPPPWFLGMSKEFQKDISHIDRKLQGKILEALTDLVTQPTEPRGDTVKPLKAEFRGCWRYRIGDFRLVYSPDMETGNITLLAFSARGAVYDA